MRVPELFALRRKREHARVNRDLTTVFRNRSTRSTRIRLHEGTFTSHYLSNENIWLVAHALPDRHRNAFGPGDPVGRRNVWPSVQLNLALAPGSARPHARFLRDARVRVEESEETLLVLGTLANPDALVIQVAKLAHAASAYRDALAAGLSLATAP